MQSAEPLLTSFLRDLRAEGRSSRTLTLYGLGIRQFFEWSGGWSLDNFTRANMKDWVAEVSVTRWSPATVQSRVSALRRFGAWLIAEEYLQTNPARNIPQPVIRDEAPEILSDEQLSMILKALSGRDFLSRRNTAIVRVLLDTGVRVAELCGMNVGTTDLDEEMTVVLGKGNKPRPVYFSHKTVQAIDRYLRIRGDHDKGNTDPLWLSQRGGRLGTEAVRELLRIVGAEVGIEGLHPHRFRHTWAHDHLLNETSTVDLKRLAGWTSDAMLSRYGRSGADVRAAATARKARRGDRV